MTENKQDQPTASYVVTALDKAQKAFEATVDPQAARVERKDAIWSYIHHVSIAVWHEALAQVLPESAALAREWLETALEDDTAAQWVHEARADVAAGRPIRLPYDVPEVSQ